ncbi:MAG: hypothetical protein WCI38_09195 [Chthoniobacterales bacterium]
MRGEECVAFQKQIVLATVELDAALAWCAVSASGHENELLLLFRLRFHENKLRPQSLEVKTLQCSYLGTLHSHLDHIWACQPSGSQHVHKAHRSKPVVSSRIARKARHLISQILKTSSQPALETVFGTGNRYFNDREEGNGTLNLGAMFFRAHTKTLENSHLLTGIMLW